MEYKLKNISVVNRKIGKFKYCVPNINDILVSCMIMCIGPKKIIYGMQRYTLKKNNLECWKSWEKESAVSEHFRWKSSLQIVNTIY